MLFELNINILVNPSFCSHIDALLKFMPVLNNVKKVTILTVLSYVCTCTVTHITIDHLYACTIVLTWAASTLHHL